MLRKATFCFFVLCLAVASRAQTNIHDLFEFNVSPLVTTTELPPGFELFVPDTATQILFNPARALTYGRRFIYGTYYANTFRTGNPTVSLAYLSGSWLFSLQNDVAIDDFESEDLTLSNNVGSTATSTLSEITSSDRERDAIRLRLKLSKFGVTSFGSYAFGLFGFVNVQNDDSNAKQDRVSRSVAPAGENRFSSSSVSNSLRQRDSDLSGFAVGFEAGLAGAGWDFRSALSIQRPESDSEPRSSSSQSRRDTTFFSGQPPRIRVIEQEAVSNLTVDQNPTILELDTYYRKGSDLLSQDGNLFVSLNLAVAFDDAIQYEFDVSQHASVFDDSVFVVQDSLANAGSGSVDSGFWTARFSVGYVFSKQLSDLYLMAGINPDFTYAKFTNVSASGSSFGRSSMELSETKTIDTGVVFPLYFNYAPRRWVSAFGGFNYTYALQYEKTESTLLAQPAPDNQREGTRKRTGFRSSKNFYLGLTLRLKSSFVAHIDFNGDFGRLSNWNLSVGYHF